MSPSYSPDMSSYVHHHQYNVEAANPHESYMSRQRGLTMEGHYFNRTPSPQNHREHDLSGGGSLSTAPVMSNVVMHHGHPTYLKLESSE